MATEVLSAVRDLVPSIRERAEQTEDQRRVSDESIAELVEAGLFTMFRPRRYGGQEAAPVDFFTAIRLISSACASTGWVASLLGITPWHIALLEKSAQDDVWADGEPALATSSYAPVGRLVPTDDGYRLSGAWRAAPGADHCSWAVLGSLLVGASGDPVDYAAVLVPRADFELRGDWAVVGLRGAGSRDVFVRDAFVPLHRVYGSAGRVRIADLQRQPDADALYRVPFASIHSTAVTVPLLGAVEGAYRYHLGRMRERNRLTHGGRKGVEDQTGLVAVAQGAGEVDASILQIDRDLREQYDHAVRNAPVPIELRLRARRDQVLATKRATDAIDLLFNAAGGHAVRTAAPIQRAWRDVHTGAAHMVNDLDQGLSLYGRWAYGLGVNDSLILV